MSDLDAAKTAIDLPDLPPPGGARRRRVSLPAESVRTGRLPSGAALPLVVEPAAEGLDLAAWAKAEKARIDGWLDEHAAVLFRGFDVASVAAFERFARAVCDQLHDENGEHRPVPESGHVQTPVFYSPEKKLLWHNENSFNRSWPLRILFCCQVPAEEGGATPIVDSRAVYRHLDPALRRPFEEKGVCYLRNYSRELGLDWRTVFRTDDKAEVEARCRRDGMRFEWLPGDRLRTRIVGPAAIAHPRTGALSWFNQAQHWHPACLDPEARASLEALYEPEEMPRGCFYGDGSPIEDSVMEEVLAAYRELEVSFPWRRGDVMVVDNVLAAHARDPYRGERRILVALGDLRTTEGGP